MGVAKIGLLNFIKAAVAKKEIENQDWEKKGIQAADFIDGALDDSMGNKKSAEVLNIIIINANKFCMSFTKRLAELVKETNK